MAYLMVGNVDPETSDEEFKEFLTRYGIPPFDEIKRVEGSGARPAVLLTFNDIGPETLRKLQPRIHNMLWRDRTLSVQVVGMRKG